MNSEKNTTVSTKKFKFGREILKELEKRTSLQNKSDTLSNFVKEVFLAGFKESIATEKGCSKHSELEVKTSYIFDDNWELKEIHYPIPPL